MLLNKMNKKRIKNIVSVLGKFKDLKRKGWVLREVKTPESDAEHSFSLAFLVLMLAPQHLDLLKCLKLALIHDIPEIYSSDFIPGEISPQEKLLKEKQVINRLSSELENSEIIDLFNEFTEQKTAEAQFVSALDKIDNVFTARYYDDNSRSPQPLSAEFAQTARHKIRTSAGEAKEFHKIIDILTE